MQNNVPLLITCSILALGLNTAASIANQPSVQRSMALPGAVESNITPPLLIEAGDWDSPAPTSPTRSLFGDTAPISERVQARASAAVTTQRIPSEAKVASGGAPQHGQVRQAALTFAEFEKDRLRALPATPSPPLPKVVAPNPTAPSDVAVDKKQDRVPTVRKIGPVLSERASAARIDTAKNEVSGEASDKAVGPSVVATASMQKQQSKAVAAAPAPLPPPKAAETIRKEPPAPAVRFTGSEGKAKALELAVLKTDGATAGDLLDLSRKFDDWTLACTMRLDLNERVCGVQQEIRPGGDTALLWKIATSADGKPVIVFEFDDEVDPKTGFVVSISGFEKKIPATEWSCKDGRCQASMQIVGPVAGWFSDSPKISFNYARSGKPFALQASMKGFQKAMLASHNPIGSRSAAGDAPVPTAPEKTALAR